MIPNDHNRTPSNNDHLRNQGPLIQPADIDGSAASLLVNHLVAAGVRGLLLDWDGCMTALNGGWHGVLVNECLARCPSFKAQVTLKEAIDAYEGPGHGIDWFALFENYLVRPKLQELPDCEKRTAQVMHELRIQMPIVAQEFAEGHFAREVIIRPNPGVEEFLTLAREAGISLTVITMTPTAIVKAFAGRSGLSRLISDFHGCETFADFPETKLDPELWVESASRAGLSIQDVAIVEDSKRSLTGAVRSGAAVVISLTPGVQSLYAVLSPSSELWIAQSLGDMNSVAIPGLNSH